MYVSKQTRKLRLLVELDIEKLSSVTQLNLKLLCSLFFLDSFFPWGEVAISFLSGHKCHILPFLL